MPLVLAWNAIMQAGKIVLCAIQNCLVILYMVVFIVICYPIQQTYRLSDSEIELGNLSFQQSTFLESLGHKQHGNNIPSLVRGLRRSKVLKKQDIGMDQ